MNVFNQQQLEQDESGLLESCDVCNALIHNWDRLQMCWVTFDNKIVCIHCKHDLVVKACQEKQLTFCNKTGIVSPQ